ELQMSCQTGGIVKGGRSRYIGKGHGRICEVWNGLGQPCSLSQRPSSKTRFRDKRRLENT
ncbi:MAG: hypothetical protein RMK18_08350, partial [Armatimonadota bacterium]|nr:hypothetical protein [Armatimonadota bacterium]